MAATAEPMFVIELREADRSLISSTPTTSIIDTVATVTAISKRRYPAFGDSDLEEVVARVEYAAAERLVAQFAFPDDSTLDVVAPHIAEGVV